MSSLEEAQTDSFHIRIGATKVSLGPLRHLSHRMYVRLGVEDRTGPWVLGPSKDAEISLGRGDTFLAGSFHSSLNDRV